MDVGLWGEKAIVTGATKGIGRGVIELLIAEGADIGCRARTADEVNETVQALQRPDNQVIGDAVNVRDAEAYEAWLERTMTGLGGCDVSSPA